jgi:DNA repair exonuclease SbcCD nuclease subunit
MPWTTAIVGDCSRVNYESSNVNVGLPIFTIHGNHDDPSGANSLSAVDLLSTTSLVNYFGKIVSAIAFPLPLC